MLIGVVPVPLGKHVLTTGTGWILEHRNEAATHHCRRLVQPRHGCKRRGQINDAGQAGVHATGRDPFRPAHHQRGADARIVNRPLGPGKRFTVVPQENDQGVVEPVSLLQLRDQRANVLVHPANLVVVHREIPSGRRRVQQVWRHNHPGRIVGWLQGSCLIRAMGITKTDPHEKRTVARRLRLVEKFRELTNRLPVPVELFHAVATVVGLEHVAGEVPRLLQRGRDQDPIGRQRHVKVFGSGLMRIPAAEDADPRRAAG